MDRSSLIAEARVASEKADKAYTDYIAIHGNDGSDTYKSLMREAESRYGVWAEWYYNTQ